MHNHHIVHAARGVSHVWTAAIVSGLAVVLTMTVAFTTVSAQTEKQMDPMTLVLRALYRIEMRLDRMEPRLNRVSEFGSTGLNAGSAMETPKAQCYLQCVADAQGDANQLGVCVSQKCPDMMRKDTPMKTMATSTPAIEKKKEPAPQVQPVKPTPTPVPVDKTQY